VSNYRDLVQVDKNENYSCDNGRLYKSVSDFDGHMALVVTGHTGFAVNHRHNVNKISLFNCF